MLQKKQSLKPYNTFGINAYADSFKSASSIKEISDVIKNTKEDLFILGGGSNLLLTSDINKTVLHVNTKGKKIIKKLMTLHL